ncbi:hypothetical protein EYC84_002468 [Monilinia fructicola]|uniref:Uncharacterized protein n=1 Tax=Monilinia fructicola TaxID=38448 RepID=A0A5M9JKV8_MONFR|nr:hypothetical protein EYC84_002468 [Monilinia fructicola]
MGGGDILVLCPCSQCLEEKHVTKSTRKRHILRDKKRWDRHPTNPNKRFCFCWRCKQRSMAVGRSGKGYYVCRRTYYNHNTRKAPLIRSGVNMESNKNALSSHESDLGGPSTQSGMRGEDSNHSEMDVLSGIDDVGNEDAFDNEARDSGEIHRQHGATRELPGQWRIDDGNDEVEREINELCAV